MIDGLAGIPRLKDLDLNEKTVFLRLDLNTPMKDGRISDETRIQTAIPTIQYILEHKCKLVIASHLGRPRSDEDRKKLSLEPIAERLSELLNVEVHLMEEPDSDAPKTLLPTIKGKKIIMLENLRFSKDETQNGDGLAEAIASYCNVYVNDAFGASHRKHSSIYALNRLIPERAVGFLIEKEVQTLDKLLNSKEKPYVTILGGAKVSDKIRILDKLINPVDTFIIGGAMAYTFLKAKGIPVGNSLVEKESFSFAKDFIKRVDGRDKKILLPIDHVIAETLENPKDIQITKNADIADGYMGLDIGPKTRKQFNQEVLQAKLVFWNGPMGLFENPNFAAGTFELAKALGQCPGDVVVGGGDTASAVNASGYADKMMHISTGGGASLEYLQGDKLPGLEAFRARY